MTLMMQAMIEKTVSEKINFVKLKICLRQKIDEIVSSPRYLVKVIEALLDLQ